MWADTLFHSQANSHFFSSTKQSLTFSLAPSCFLPGTKSQAEMLPHAILPVMVGGSEGLPSDSKSQGVRRNARGEGVQPNYIGRAFLGKEIKFIFACSQPLAPAVEGY